MTYLKLKKVLLLTNRDQTIWSNLAFQLS